MNKNQVLQPNYYRNHYYSPKNHYSLSFHDNSSLNIKTINININQSPSSPLMFEVPRQNPNINYVPRTPSPSYNRRNFINLSDNSKFKESSGSQVIYHKLRGMDSINNYPSINYSPIRNQSPPIKPYPLHPLNLKKNGNNNFISLYQNYPIYININTFI